MNPLVTMKQMAADLGLSVQAVSCALRGIKGVSGATRQRVRAHAAKVGYRPDAGLRALADFRTHRRKVATRWNTVALVHNWPSAQALLKNEFYERWFGHLREAAEDKGITLQLHWLGAQGEQCRSVFRSLRHQGITGVFVAPPAPTLCEPLLDIPGKTFQIVSFAPEHLYPELHTVQFDFYENLRLAWKVLRERGHRRIGLVYAKYQAWRTGYAWRGAFHVEKFLAGWPPGVMMPLEIEVQGLARQKRAYLQWLRKDRYEAVISSIPEVVGWTREAGGACEVAMFNVHSPRVQGVDLNLPLMARTAVDLLTTLMQQSLQQGRNAPFRVHIPGKWVGRQSGKAGG